MLHRFDIQHIFLKGFQDGILIKKLSCKIAFVIIPCFIHKGNMAPKVKRGITEKGIFMQKCKSSCSVYLKFWW